MSIALHEPEAKLAACCSAGSCALSAHSQAHTNWAATPVRARLAVLRAARHLMAQRASEFADAISPRLARSKADTLVTELLPLLDACKFLEKNAERLLKPLKLGVSGRPFWLGGVRAEVHREALGHVLVIGPANFPLFLPGTQVLQALAAGNTVTWKPGSEGQPVAALVAYALCEAGLPDGVLRIAADTVQSGRDAVATRPDKVVFTGSANAGKAVLTELAKTATPAVVELSGADAIIVLPSADLQLVARAVAFGLRLNGAAVCMSPRRLFASDGTMRALRPLLAQALERVPPVALDRRCGESLAHMLAEAQDRGASIHGALQPREQRPLLVDDATPGMAIACSDIFAPVLSLIALPSLLHLHDAYEQCRYALTAAIFCAKSDEQEARAIARSLRAGTVLINDLIAPAADPRVPFGGRGASGYGVTRGAEGLLEMTAVKTLLVRRVGAMRHLEATSDADVPMFDGLIRVSHGRAWSERGAGLRQLIAAYRARHRQERRK